MQKTSEKEIKEIFEREKKEELYKEENQLRKIKKFGVVRERKNET